MGLRGGILDEINNVERGFNPTKLAFPYKYVLRNGRDIVGYGVSDAPDARLSEHQRHVTSMRDLRLCYCGQPGNPFRQVFPL